MIMGILLICTPGVEFKCDLFLQAFKSESECFATSDGLRPSIPDEYDMHTYCMDITEALEAVE